MRQFVRVLAAAAAWSCVCMAWGQSLPTTQAGPDRFAATRPGPEGLRITHHVIHIGPRALAYTAAAGRLRVAGPSGKGAAEVFFVAYTLDGREGDATRPVTFAFNGGPGASSVFLHMGAIGPRRTDLGKDGLSLPERLELCDNAYTWLGFTDLVFIDPVGTGFSRPAAGVDGKPFYGLEGDTESMAEFIRLYCTLNDRWTCPKYLAGESYGATRAAALAAYLPQRVGLYPDGLVLLSAALNFQAIAFENGNDLPYALYLPSYTAAAWAHGKLGPALQADAFAAVRQAKEWAMGEYMAALAEGDGLAPARRDQIAHKLAEFTGLSETFIRRHELRITNVAFAQELLRDQDQALGLYDARVAGLKGDIRREGIVFDPSLFLTVGPFVSTFCDYVRTDLCYRDEHLYEFLSEDVHRDWNWGADNGYVNVSARLRDAMNANPHMPVLAAAGYFDLVTGFYAQQYVYDHLGLAEPVRPNLQFHCYGAGHQLYTHLPSLEQFSADVERFMTRKAESGKQAASWPSP